MRTRFIIAIFASVFLGCGADVGVDPPRLTDDADWVVRVVFSQEHACTATVLSEHWLLTAGHCLAMARDEQIEVSHEVFGERRVVFQGAAQLIIHPNYEPMGHLSHRWYDVGLVGLRDGILDAGDRARLSGVIGSFTAWSSEEEPLYTIGYGHSPDPNTGLCSGELGSKKRYDGLFLHGLLGPPFAPAYGVELQGRRDALCDGDSGAPFLFDVEGIPHVFAVFSGENFNQTLFYGTLNGPKIDWFKTATTSSHAPLDCRDLGNDSWECFE